MDISILIENGTRTISMDVEKYVKIVIKGTIWTIITNADL